MKRRNKIILAVISILLLLGLYIFYIITKKPMTAADSKPYKSMDAIVLLNELDSNFHNIDSIYTNKNIEVIGKIKDIDTSTKHIFITLEDNSSINCSFSKEEFEKFKSGFKIGSQTQIKGIYSGAEGFDKKNDNELDMIANEKIIYLRTCTINK